MRQVNTVQRIRFLSSENVCVLVSGVRRYAGPTKESWSVMNSVSIKKVRTGGDRINPQLRAEYSSLSLGQYLVQKTNVCFLEVRTRGSPVSLVRIEIGKWEVIKRQEE